MCVCLCVGRIVSQSQDELQHIGCHRIESIFSLSLHFCSIFNWKIPICCSAFGAKDLNGNCAVDDEIRKIITIINRFCFVHFFHLHENELIVTMSRTKTKTTNTKANNWCSANHFNQFSHLTASDPRTRWHDWHSATITLTMPMPSIFNVMLVFLILFSFVSTYISTFPELCRVSFVVSHV